MKISILMSLYIKEKARYFDECLYSIHKQTLNPDEVVIVLDGPITLELRNVLDKWSIELNLVILPLSENIGLGKALNYGLANCKNEYVARMDTDDICAFDRLEKQMNFFKKNPSITICGSNITEVDGETLQIISERNVYESHEKILEDVNRRNPFNHMTVMYRKSHILSVKSYEHLPMMEDWYLWIRLLSYGYKAANINESLVIARTGKDMLERRKGIKYIKSEWLIKDARKKYLQINPFYNFIIFIQRSIPRVLPLLLINILYKKKKKRMK